MKQKKLYNRNILSVNVQQHHGHSILDCGHFELTNLKTIRKSSSQISGSQPFCIHEPPNIKIKTCVPPESFSRASSVQYCDFLHTPGQETLPWIVNRDFCRTKFVDLFCSPLYGALRSSSSLRSSSRARRSKSS